MPKLATSEVWNWRPENGVMGKNNFHGRNFRVVCSDGALSARIRTLVSNF